MFLTERVSNLCMMASDPRAERDLSAACIRLNQQGMLHPITIIWEFCLNKQQVRFLKCSALQIASFCGNRSYENVPNQ